MRLHLIELSHAIEAGMPRFPGLASPKIEPLWTHGDAPGRGYHDTTCELTRIEMVTSVGTYLDAPFHFDPDGPDISQLSLDQLVLPLKNAGLLRGVKGPGGGYLLGRAAEEIRLDEIVESEIGPISVVDCVASDDFCDRTDDCACRLVYSLVSHRVRSALGELTLADLADRTRLDAIRKELAAE